ncbi:DUF4412 domain-containing protein [Autumnicola musiva]|uniref:DUF4412 domain-containing protein n=1 Tax=Autumnicola musiva TaxID=3075589 RepID=A0ABU3D6M0_9FLAO|nr:DUF4412 domain-containing protein [Zunongwangia sp. F117]MDT0677175.1 DUF4412 domain-containing protein [Zunongwangia sp. F117]
MKKLLYLSLGIFILSVFSAEAQLFKKLTKKVEEKVEDAVVKNVSDKAENETNKKLDQLWETKLNNTSFPVGTKMIDPAKIPATYSFDWEYKLNMKTAGTEMEMIYFLKKDAGYFGMKIPQAPQMFTVLDEGNKISVMYISSEEKNHVMATKFTEPSENPEGNKEFVDMQFKEIGRKSIRGYKCRGYKTENKNSVFTFYVTDEAGISFSDIFQAHQEKFPEGFDGNLNLLKNGEGLVMQMQMEDKGDPSKDVVITCIGIEKRQFSINKSDYK